MDMNFFLEDSWWPFLAPLIIAANLIILVPWWQSMTHWCVVSKSLNQLIKRNLWAQATVQTLMEDKW